VTKGLFSEKGLSLLSSHWNRHILRNTIYVIDF